MTPLQGQMSCLQLSLAYLCVDTASEEEDVFSSLRSVAGTDCVLFVRGIVTGQRIRWWGHLCRHVLSPHALVVSSCVLSGVCSDMCVLTCAAVPRQRLCMSVSCCSLLRLHQQPLSQSNGVCMNCRSCPCTQLTCALRCMCIAYAWNHNHALPATEWGWHSRLLRPNPNVAPPTGCRMCLCLCLSSACGHVRVQHVSVCHPCRRGSGPAAIPVDAAGFNICLLSALLSYLLP